MPALRTRLLPVAALSLLALAGCNGGSRQAAPTLATGALPVMERVALAANQCWFKSGDPAFAAYKLAPELNSYSGRPRILLVDRHHPESRPSLVVQAEGSPARMDAFGPLMGNAVGGRITADVNRWARGSKSCS